MLASADYESANREGPSHPARPLRALHSNRGAVKLGLGEKPTGDKRNKAVTRLAMNDKFSTTAPALTSASDYWPASGLFPVIAALTLAMAATVISGCAPSALRTTRQQMAAGQYAAAHRELAALLANPRNLSPAELREARDDLCLTEHKIGAPAYPLTAQRQTCLIAAREPGSQSGPILAAIETSMRNETANRVEQALRRSDVVEAEDAAIEYQALPGGDPALMADWSKRMWRIVHQQIVVPRTKRRRGSVNRTVAKLRKRYKVQHRMTKSAFMQWVEDHGTVNGVPIYSEVSLSRSILRLTVPKSNLPTASLNLGRFTTVNDAMAARCGCDARTEVSVAETRFPLYVVALDPATGGSEALILPHQ